MCFIGHRKPGQMPSPVSYTLITSDSQAFDDDTSNRVSRLANLQLAKLIPRAPEPLETRVESQESRD